MTGKRGALRLYQLTRPRKRNKKEEVDYLVHLSFFADDVRVHDDQAHEVVEFINRTMKREFNLSIGRDGAIVNYHTDKDGKGWILEAASTDLAKKVCNLHGIYYNYHPLNIRKFGSLSSPASWCWNDYCLKRYGKNAHFVDHHILATVLKSEGDSGIDGLKLQSKLNERMQEFKLASTNAITKTVKIKSEGDNDKFLLNMRTRGCANSLTYLNHINIDNLLITLERLPEWKGEEPRYQHFDAFLKDHHLEEAKRTHIEIHPSSTGSPDGDVSKVFAEKAPSGVQELDSKAAAFQEDASIIIPIQDDEELQQDTVANGDLNVIVAKQTTNKVLRASLGNGKLTAKDERIAQLEKILEEQRNYLEETQRDMETNANEIRARMRVVGEKSAQRIAKLEETVEAQKNDMEEMRRNMEANTKEASARMKLVCEKSAQKDDRIGELEKIVEEQKTNLEETRVHTQATAKEMSARMKLVGEKSAQRIAELEKIVEEQKAKLEETLGKLEANAQEASVRMKLVGEKSAQRIGQLEKIVEAQKYDLEEMEATTKETSARMNLVRDKSAQKDDIIAQLENIVQDQQKDIEDERRKVSRKEVEVDTLRGNHSFRKKELELHRRMLISKEEENARLHSNVANISKELESTVMKLNAVHQSWGNQVLMLEAKDKEIAVLEAKLEKVHGAILWRPDMDVKEKLNCNGRTIGDY